MYGAGLCLLRFFFLKIIVNAVLLRKQLFQIFRRLAGNILNGKRPRAIVRRIMNPQARPLGAFSAAKVSVQKRCKQGLRALDKI